MSYAPYPAYKDSGVPWLGQVPEEWRLVRSDAVVRSLKNTIEKSAFEDELVYHYSIPVVQETGEGQVEEGASIQSSKLLIDRTKLLVSKLNPRKATICLARPWEDLLTVASSEFVPLEMSSGLNEQFAFYFWNSESVRQDLDSRVQSVTRSHQRVDPTDISKLILALPPIEEQTAIAHFLDEKTAEIDDLIAKKEELLRLLAEQRTALITHAVTNGLNPSAPMKPSGIDWLGDVPERWRVVPFKWCCQVQSGQVDPKLDEYKSLPLIAPDHIESGTGRLLPYESAEEQGAISGKYQFEAGEVLYSKIRPELSKVALAPEAGLCSADMYAIRAMEGLRPEFLFFQMLSRHFHRFAVLESMRVAMPKINRESLGDFPVMVPDADAQDEILDHVKTELAKMDLAEEKITTVRNHLKEYRTAVITNAVTGKIKVA